MSCIQVAKTENGEVRASLLDELPANESTDAQPVVIDVHYSSLNYKDALAATGHPGVARKLPLIPGIDAAGVVVESGSPQFSVGQAVLATGYQFGVDRDGGWSTRLIAPAEWVVDLPAGLTLREAMIYGTAGFTAGQSVDALLHHGVKPDGGEVVVTGATGGVGSLAVAILSRLGYQVAAVTGKADRRDWLRTQLGAARCLGREELYDESDRPLLKGRWAGGVDTVGGTTLSTMLRSVKHRGCVTACGLVGGADLPLTVHPFILRGVTLSGIDSSMCPMASRRRIWQQLAGPWKSDGLEALATSVTLSEVLDQVPRILDGKLVGRVVVDVRDAE